MWLVSRTARSVAVSRTATGMPGRPPTLMRNFPRPGGSVSLPVLASHEGGADHPVEALGERDEHSATLAAQAVVVVTQADPKATSGDVQRVVDGYTSLAREAVAVPFDPGMVDGVLRYGSLRPGTQRAWLAAGAAVARGL